MMGENSDAKYTGTAEQEYPADMPFPWREKKVKLNSKLAGMLLRVYHNGEYRQGVFRGYARRGHIMLTEYSGDGYWKGLHKMFGGFLVVDEKTVDRVQVLNEKATWDQPRIWFYAGERLGYWLYAVGEDRTIVREIDRKRR
jgi:hypothetical protein